MRGTIKIILIAAITLLILMCSVFPLFATSFDTTYNKKTVSTINSDEKEIIAGYIRDVIKMAITNNLNGSFNSNSDNSTGLSVRFPEENLITENAVQYRSYEYFPVYPGTIWEYLYNGYLKGTVRVHYKTVIVNGVRTSVFKYNNYKEYYTSDANGINLHRLYFPNFPIPNLGKVNLTLTFTPPFVLANGTIEVGQSFQSSGIIRSNVLPLVGSIKIPYDASFNFASTQNLTVPAGNFDVLEISGYLTLFNEITPITYYIAEDIGPVKELSNGNTMELTAVYYVELASPSKGDFIPSGVTYSIYWKAPSYTAYFKLQYSMDNGLTWNTITPTLITGSSYDWTVPVPNNNKKRCLINILGYDSNRIQKVYDKSAPFTIEVVKLTSPDGGEILTSNTIWPVTWNTNATASPVARVILQYTNDGGLSWKTITKITGSNPGTYDWNVPLVSKAKSKCRVKIILQNAVGKVVGTDTSNNYFTISP